jgi:hypothetical protein
LKVSRRFGGKCRLRVQSRRISQAGNQHEAGSNQSYLLHAGFLLGLLFYREDEGDIFFRRYIPEDITLVYSGSPITIAYGICLFLAPDARV